jgi:hypothetical protein
MGGLQRVITKTAAANATTIIKTTIIAIIKTTVIAITKATTPKAAATST